MGQARPGEAARPVLPASEPLPRPQAVARPPGGRPGAHLLGRPWLAVPPHLVLREASRALTGPQGREAGGTIGREVKRGSTFTRPARGPPPTQEDGGHTRTCAQCSRCVAYNSQDNPRGRPGRRRKHAVVCQALEYHTAMKRDEVPNLRLSTGKEGPCRAGSTGQAPPTPTKGLGPHPWEAAAGSLFTLFTSCCGWVPPLSPGAGVHTLVSVEASKSPSVSRQLWPSGLVQRGDPAGSPCPLTPLPLPRKEQPPAPAAGPLRASEPASNGILQERTPSPRARAGSQAQATPLLPWPVLHLWNGNRARGGLSGVPQAVRVAPLPHPAPRDRSAQTPGPGLWEGGEKPAPAWAGSPPAEGGPRVRSEPGVLSVPRP